MSYQNNIPSQNLSSQNMQSDRTLLIAVIFLVVIGLMSIFSASAPKCIEMGVNPARFLIQQILGVIAGILGLKFLSNFHYKKLMYYTLPFAFFKATVSPPALLNLKGAYKPSCFLPLK